MQGEKSEWILCPVCQSRTRIKVRKDTTLLNFPLFCPKCRRETLINIVDSKICSIKE
ncbi:conjugal transfer protein [Subdoligranulum sp. AM23-21AC]|uniref:cysteine-rich KTR domain-containing protein n=1 Tax=Ruthenibacterium lactatiformans TaxID=1550024 RepID=UPI000E3F2675|nr:cysteine-rich KTR domain-containing protein [Ruthenibacterium lactatiformans]RGD16946.1 conjugal transfer protein [Subdoligranulum sp. AM23-21AC]RJW24809.1 conjugal transfer protein [Subdoligranulum sp. TF05-17AC]